MRYIPTKDFEFYSFNINIDDKVIKLNVLDTCGEKNQRFSLKRFYKESCLIILVYAINE